MAISASTDFQEFKVLLSKLLSVDNDTRKQAELQYEGMNGNERFFMTLSAVSDDSISLQEAELAAVLLRRLITNEFVEIFSKLAPEIQNQAKSQILLRIQQSVNPHLKRKISDIAAELVRKSIDEEGNNHWPDFLKYLFDAAHSPDPYLRELSLLMFSSVPGVFGNQQDKYIDVIHQMLCQSLIDQQSEKVRLAAVKAISSFILTNEKEIHIQKKFADCLNLILQFLAQVLYADKEQPDDILGCLVDLAEICPQFFKGQLDALMQVCIKGMSDPGCGETCRNTSLETVVSLCESAPSMVKKCVLKHITTIVTIVLKMMTDLDDDDNWAYSNEAEDNDDSLPVIAEASLDRLACALGGKTILPPVLNILPQMLNSSEWKDRYAGLMAISAIGEGCHKQMLSLLPQVIDSILPFLIDQQVRVRYAACNALGQMSTDFGSNFQKKFHEKVLPALLQVLMDSSCLRVQAHAGAALVNFFEECPKYILVPYMDKIITTLESVLTTTLKEVMGKGTTLVLEQVVVTLASLADSAQERFTNYYDKFMPYLKYIIQNANQPELRLLRGKTIECISLIGLAVEKEKFLNDAGEVMDLLLKTQSEDTAIADDDPQLSYMIAAWARICKILGKAFKPYLPYVMPPVLKAASLMPEITVMDSNDPNDIAVGNDWEFVNLGDKPSIGIRTAGLEDKATACQMLVCYAKELNEGFIDYVEQTVQLMVPLLKFYFHDGVRIAASEILPSLLESAKGNGEAYIQEMCKFIFPALLQAIESEPEIEVLCEHLSAFAQCLEVLKCPCLQPGDLQDLIGLLNKNLASHFEKYAEREAKRKEEDYDEEVEDTLVKEDDDDIYLLSKIAEIMTALFTIYKQDFFNYFDMLLPHFACLIEPSRPWADQQWAMCIFADVIEATGPACTRYQQYFLQPLSNSVTHESVELRQTACYTLGILGQFGGPEFVKYCSDSIPLLLQVINDPNSRSEENERATENAISAVTKFLVAHSLMNMEELLPVWLTWLPVWEDEEETQYIFNFLCTLLETNNQILLGNNNCNLPRIVQIIAEAFLKDAIELTTELGKRIITLVQDIQKNADMFSICVNHLNPDQQKALHTALTAQ